MTRTQMTQTALEFLTNAGFEIKAALRLFAAEDFDESTRRAIDALETVLRAISAAENELRLRATANEAMR